MNPAKIFFSGTKQNSYMDITIELYVDMGANTICIFVCFIFLSVYCILHLYSFNSKHASL